MTDENFRAVLNYGQGFKRVYRAKTERQIRDLIEVRWLGEIISKFNWQKLMTGETVHFTAFGECTVQKVPATKGLCGECYACTWPKLGEKCINADE